MQPLEFAKYCPHLFHMTTAGAGARIVENGLFTTKDILDRWEFSEDEKINLMTRRRIEKVHRHHPVHGSVTISDNAPLNESKLAGILDDGLTAPQWLHILNSRVFFFTSEKQLQKLRNARLNKTSPKDILKIDTFGFAKAYAHFIEIVPFNSGVTLYDTPRRGLTTFAPLLDTDYRKWRVQRANKTADVIKEVAVRGSIPNIADFVLDIQEGVVE